MKTSLSGSDLSIIKKLKGNRCREVIMNEL